MTSRFAGFCTKCRQQYEAGTEITRDQQSGKWVHQSCPQAAPVVESAPVAKLSTDEIGVYVLADESIVQTKASKQNAGRVYAKRWTHIGGVRLTDAGERVNAEYVYEAGLGQVLAGQLANGSAHKMTADEAHAFSLKYGVCARCARQLKDATSVSLALGPICRGYFGIELENSRRARARQEANVAAQVVEEDPGNRAERLLAEKEYAEDRAALEADRAIERQISDWSELQLVGEDEDYAF